MGLRALAEAAGVNLGATTYHYGSKENLYIETFMRRFRPTHAERRRLLSEAEASAGGQPLPVTTIVECMVRPPFTTVLRYPNFPGLLARNIFMPPPFMRQVVQEEMAPDVEAFVRALARSLPEIPPELLLLRQAFSMGAVLVSAGQLASLPAPARIDPQFFDYALQELIRFIAAGLASPPAVSAAARPPLPFSPLRP